MKVLIVGGGGREHALAWKLRREWPDADLLAAPGNPGIAGIARCAPVGATDVAALAALAERERPDFTLVGPEAPLAAGIVDEFRARGLPIFGPTRAAAEIETSKAFAKRLMLEHGIPTAHAERHTDAVAAKRAARAFGAPVVIKASGLAAGKGVLVCETLEEADRAIDHMLRDEGFGQAGLEILVEEFMTGEELSVFAITDGETAVVLPAAQDHKRLLAGDRGPNTGGMGAYAPCTAAGGVNARLDPVIAIVEETVDVLRASGRPFTGLLYAGLMLTPTGPRVVEFNCRFGDPETQALLPYLDAEFPDLPIGTLMHEVAAGEPLAGTQFIVRGGHAAVTTVVAAEGYPDRPRTGDPIALPPVAASGVHVFHAGTARDAHGRLVTAGGRVLAVTAVAPTIEQAQAESRRYAEQVAFEGKQFRGDIAWREVGRRAGAA